MCWLACLPSSVSVPAAHASTSVVSVKSFAAARNSFRSGWVERQYSSTSTSFMPPYSPAMYEPHIRASWAGVHFDSRLCTQCPMPSASCSASALPARACASSSPARILCSV